MYIDLDIFANDVDVCVYVGWLTAVPFNQSRRVNDLTFIRKNELYVA